jgi:hypothetical protein
MENRKMTRRQFVKNAATTGIAAALARDGRASAAELAVRTLIVFLHGRFLCQSFFSFWV